MRSDQEIRVGQVWLSNNHDEHLITRREPDGWLVLRLGKASNREILWSEKRMRLQLQRLVRNALVPA